MSSTLIKLADLKKHAALNEIQGINVIKLNHGRGYIIEATVGDTPYVIKTHRTGKHDDSPRIFRQYVTIERIVAEELNTSTFTVSGLI